MMSPLFTCVLKLRDIIIKGAFYLPVNLGKQLNYPILFWSQKDSEFPPKCKLNMKMKLSEISGSKYRNSTAEIPRKGSPLQNVSLGYQHQSFVVVVVSLFSHRFYRANDIIFGGS